MITVTPAAEDNDDDEYPSPQIEDSDVEEDEKDQEEQEDDESRANRLCRSPTPQHTFPSLGSLCLFLTTSLMKMITMFLLTLDIRSLFVRLRLLNDLPMSTPPRSTLSRSVRAPSPSTSSIPRPKSFINNFSSSSSTLVDSDSSFSSVTTSASIMSPSPPSKLPIRSSSFATPPTNTKRVGAAPSFIPQPAPVSSVSFPSSSPSPMRKGPTLRERPSGTVASFIRQPARKTPLMAAASKTGHNDSDSIPNGSASSNSNPNYTSPAHADSADSSSVRSISRFEASYSSSIEAEAGDGLTSINSNSTPQSSSPSLSSIMTSPKLSFLSGFIPRPWESASVPGAVPVTKSKSNPTSRVYVSRDRQLERLRLRLQHDGSRFFSEDVCQRCDGAVVYL
ncbi:hypothetical protein BT96DRAFT_997470 [Gymnopus androsaceus JB14]|uniref:Uncharacterized protein n=1 Tax=Gymnopus androsaceus JB14 TaxID=1447944 RepID=A0A6A4HBJ9_9AGAR|nr:hypothetical protein BT96DRAFT_997470 [Gymnopus androsaceus JB14]